MAEAENDEGTQKSGGASMKIVIIAAAISIVLSGAMVGGALVFLGGDDDQQQAEAEAGDEEEDAETEVSEPPIYYSMDPKFVVSFRDQRNARFMQFSLEVMARDRDVIEDIKEHSPAVRSNLLLLVDNQDSEKMSTREGKEQLLVEMTDDINRTLDSIGGTSGVEAAYYNSFVIQ